MDRPNTMQNTSIGTYAGMGSVDCRPIRLLAQPHWKMATMTPKAAPIERMLRIAALIAITTDRNAVVSSRNEIATTARISQISRPAIWLLKSTDPAVGPVTY